MIRAHQPLREGASLTMIPMNNEFNLFSILTIFSLAANANLASSFLNQFMHFPNSRIFVPFSCIIIYLYSISFRLFQWPVRDGQLTIIRERHLFLYYLYEQIRYINNNHLIQESLKLAPMQTTFNNRNLPSQLQRQPNPQPQQQVQQQPDQNAEAPKKKKRGIALKPQHFQNPTKGLKRLYQLTNQIRWEDQMTTQSAMNLVVVTIKSWQTQLLPKYYYEYFLQRCQALGSDKQVSAYMHKVRRIHKGLDTWNEAKNENNDPNAPTGKPPNRMNAQSDGEGNLGGQGESENYVNYEDDANDLQKFRQRAEVAKKLGQTYPQTNRKQQAKAHSHTNQQQVDELMDEDLRMFQEMNRRKNVGSSSKGRVQQQQQDQGMELGGESGVVEDDYYDD